MRPTLLHFTRPHSHCYSYLLYLMSGAEIAAAQQRLAHQLRYWKAFRFPGIAAGVMNFENTAKTIGTESPLVYARKDHSSRWLVCLDPYNVVRRYLTDGFRFASRAPRTRLCFTRRRYGLGPLIWIQATMYQMEKPRLPASLRHACKVYARLSNFIY